MSWQAEITTIVRYLVDDVDATQTYSDGRLETTIVVAAQQVQDDLDFINVYAADIPGTGISPDPTTPTRDNTFINLVSLKAACMIDKASYRTAIGQGIKVKDGSSSIDTTGSFGGHQFLLENGNCAEYETAKLEYKMYPGEGYAGGVPGEAVVGPYRTLFYNSNHGFISDRG
jgi:hypothetical protein